MSRDGTYGNLSSGDIYHMHFKNPDKTLGVATGSLLLATATATYFLPSHDPEIRLRPIGEGVNLIKVEPVKNASELTREEAIEAFKRSHPDSEILGAFQVNLNSKELKDEIFASELTWVIMTNSEPPILYGPPKP